jgi:hypothetical protein
LPRSAREETRCPARPATDVRGKGAPVALRGQRERRACASDRPRRYTALAGHTARAGAYSGLWQVMTRQKGADEAMFPALLTYVAKYTERRVLRRVSFSGSAGALLSLELLCRRHRIRILRAQGGFQTDFKADFLVFSRSRSFSMKSTLSTIESIGVDCCTSCFAFWH